MLSGKPLPPGLEANWRDIGAYLGAVNSVSLFPTMILLAGVILASLRLVRSIRHRRQGAAELDPLYALLVVACTMVGYVWYLTGYQTDGQAGDLINAVHVVQVLPCLALLGRAALEVLRSRRQAFWFATILGVGVAWLYALPAMITHYVLFP